MVGTSTAESLPYYFPAVVDIFQTASPIKSRKSSVKIDGAYKHICGGTLVHQNTESNDPKYYDGSNNVLTATHCFCEKVNQQSRFDLKTMFFVRVGITDNKRDLRLRKCKQDQVVFENDDHYIDLPVKEIKFMCE